MRELNAYKDVMAQQQQTNKIKHDSIIILIISN